MISSGKSSLEAVKVLRDKGLNVKGIISIFTYGFKEAEENFKNLDCEYVSLCDYDSLLLQAVEQEYINEEDLHILKEWRVNPSNWKK